MSTLVAFAQLFGYGPTSNLFSLLRLAKHELSSNDRLFIKDNEHVRIFFKNNPNLATKLINHISYDKTDLILSCFEPLPIIKAWYHNIPSIYFCNLFWFWDVEKELDFIYSTKVFFEQQKRLGNLEKIISSFEKIYQANPHVGIYLGYLFAKHSFIRRFPGVEQKTLALKEHSTLHFTNILIPKIKTPTQAKKKMQILFQLSGSITSATLKKEHLIYITLVKKLVLKLAHIFPKINFIICCNPSLFSSININTCHNINIEQTFSQEENLKKIGESLCVFSSPGLETIFETISLRTPLFLLPEQNGGQHHNFYRLQSSGFNPDRFLVDEQFPNRIRLWQETDAHIIYEYIEKILNSGKLFNTFLNKSIIFIQNLHDSIFLDDYLSMQHNTLIKYFNNPQPYTHGEEVARMIRKELAKKAEKIQTST